RRCNQVTAIVNVYITIDAECSLGGAWENPRWRPVGADRAVMGLIGSKCYGIPLIMDILEEHGLRGTFFTEVCARDVVNTSDLDAAYRSIRDRAHDAQLHLHPVFHFYNRVAQGRTKPIDLPEHMD